MAPKNTPDFAADDEIIELTEIVEKGNPPEQSMADAADDDLFGNSGGSDVDFEKELEDLFSDSDGSIGDFDDLDDADGGYTSTEKASAQQDTGHDNFADGGEAEDSGGMDFESELDDLLGGLDDSPSASSGNEDGDTGFSADASPDFESELDDLLGGLDDTPSSSGQSNDLSQESPEKSADATSDEQDTASPDELFGGDDDDVDFGSELDDLLGSLDDTSEEEAPAPQPEPEQKSEGPVSDDDIEALLNGFDGPQADAGEPEGEEDDATADSGPENASRPDDNLDFSELDALIEDMEVPSRAPKAEPSEDDGLPDLSDLDSMMEEAAAGDAVLGLGEDEADDNDSDTGNDGIDDLLAEFDIDAAAIQPDTPEAESVTESDTDLDSAWADAAGTAPDDDNSDADDIDSELDDLLAGFDDDLGFDADDSINADGQDAVTTAEQQQNDQLQTASDDDSDDGDLDDLDALLNSFDESDVDQDITSETTSDVPSDKTEQMQPASAENVDLPPKTSPDADPAVAPGEEGYVFNPDESLDAPDMTDLDALLEGFDESPSEETPAPDTSVSDTAQYIADDSESSDDFDDIPDLDELLASDTSAGESVQDIAMPETGAAKEEQSDEDLLNELLAAADADEEQPEQQPEAVSADTPAETSTAVEDDTAQKQQSEAAQEVTEQDFATDDISATEQAGLAADDIDITAAAEIASDNAQPFEADTTDTSVARQPEQTPDAGSDAESDAVSGSVESDELEFLESPASAHETRDDVMTAVGPDTLEADDTDQFDTDFLDVSAPEDEADIDALLGEVLGDDNAVSLSGDDADDLPDLSIMDDSLAPSQTEAAFTQESELADISDDLEETHQTEPTETGQVSSHAAGEVTIDEDIDDLLEYGVETQALDSMIEEAAECVSDTSMVSGSDAEALTLRIATLEAALENLISGLPAGIITENTVEDIVDRKMAEHDAQEEAEIVPESTERSLYTTVEGVLEKLLEDDSPVMKRLLDRIDGHVNSIIGEKLPQYGENLRDDLKDYASRSAAKATADIIKEELIPLLEPLVNSKD